MRFGVSRGPREPKKAPQILKIFGTLIGLSTIILGAMMTFSKDLKGTTSVNTNILNTPHTNGETLSQLEEIVRLKRQIGMLVQQQRVGNSNGEQIPGATDAIDRWAVPPVALQSSDRCHIPPQCYDLCCVVHACLVPI